VHSAVIAIYGQVFENPQESSVRSYPVKITQEEVVDRQTVLHIELEDEDLDEYLDRGYRRVVQRTAIPGFRKGKAPRRIVERYLGRESLLNEVLDKMLPEVTSNAISAQSLDAAGMPDIELLNFTPFTLKAVVPLTPHVELGPYRDIRIPEEPVQVSEEDIQGRLELLRQNAASWIPVERPVKMGDLVTMSALGKVDSRIVHDQQDQEYFLDEDAVRPLPGFPQQLVGMKRDETKEFTLPVPLDHPAASIAGKLSHWTVTVSEIKERILPDLDDEFAKGVGDGFDSLDALRQDVERELRSEAEEKAAEQHREAVVKALLAGATVQLSPLMVEREVAHMEEERARLLARLNIRVDDHLRSIDKTAEQVRGELREDAIERLKRTFVLPKVAEAEGIVVSDQAVEERVQSILSRSSEQSGGVEDSEELRSTVRQVMLVEAAVSRLVDIARGKGVESNAPTPAKPAAETPRAQEEGIKEGVETA
jgi:trigger factor